MSSSIARSDDEEPRARLEAIVDALAAIRGESHPADHLFGYPTQCSLGYEPTPKDMLLLTLQGATRDWQWHDGDCLMRFVSPLRS